jgi:hypothetical protein
MLTAALYMDQPRVVFLSVGMLIHGTISIMVHLFFKDVGTFSTFESTFGHPFRISLFDFGSRKVS